MGSAGEHQRQAFRRNASGMGALRLVRASTGSQSWRLLRGRRATGRRRGNGRRGVACRSGPRIPHSEGNTRRSPDARGAPGSLDLGDQVTGLLGVLCHARLNPVAKVENGSSLLLGRKASVCENLAIMSEAQSLLVLLRTAE